MKVPAATVYDRDGNILFSWRPIPDPTFNRFDKTASSELIPFLESLLGPLDEEEGYYESTDFSKVGEVMTLQQASNGNGIDTFYSSLDNDGKLFGPVLRHDACGHGFRHLADEYVSVTGSPSSSEIKENNAQYRGKGWWANVDFTKDASKIRWDHMLSDSRYSSLVGNYEGGNLYSKGVYWTSSLNMMP